MRFQRGFMGEEMIKPAIEPILGDLLIAKLQQIAQRRSVATRVTIALTASRS